MVSNKWNMAALLNLLFGESSLVLFTFCFLSVKYIMLIRVTKKNPQLSPPVTALTPPLPPSHNKEKKNEKCTISRARKVSACRDVARYCVGMGVSVESLLLLLLLFSFSHVSNRGDFDQILSLLHQQMVTLKVRLSRFHTPIIKSYNQGQK